VFYKKEEEDFTKTVKFVAFHFILLALCTGKG